MKLAFEVIEWRILRIFALITDEPVPRYLSSPRACRLDVLRSFFIPLRVLNGARGLTVSDRRSPIVTTLRRSALGLLGGALRARINERWFRSLIGKEVNIRGGIPKSVRVRAIEPGLFGGVCEWPMIKARTLELSYGN